MVVCRWVQAVFPQNVRGFCGAKWQLATTCSVPSLRSASVTELFSVFLKLFTHSCEFPAWLATTSKECSCLQSHWFCVCPTSGLSVIRNLVRVCQWRLVGAEIQKIIGNNSPGLQLLLQVGAGRRYELQQFQLVKGLEHIVSGAVQVWLTTSVLGKLRMTVGGCGSIKQ